MLDQSAHPHVEMAAARMHSTFPSPNSIAMNRYPLLNEPGPPVPRREPQDTHQHPLVHKVLTCMSLFANRAGGEAYFVGCAEPAAS
jgi:hypothetical protein